MKKLVLTSILLSGIFLRLSGQCLTINCPVPVTVNNDAGVCGAVVNYSLPTMNSTCSGTVNDTFLFTGAVQTYTVPPGVTTVTIQAWGAQGGANWVNNVNYGGYSKADFAVTPGEILNVYVGGQATSIIGGFNGGGNGEGAGKGGGGASDVRQSGNTLNDRIIVAGGGGGAGYWSNLHVVGGVGGGMTGGDGYRDPDYASNPGGLGGGQSAAGANGTCVSFYNTACAGTFGVGGAPAGCGCEGYGGGGGWYGGAGSGNCRGGGGGSGYILPIAANPTMTAGITVGNGKIIIGAVGVGVPTLTQTGGLASGATFPVGTTTNTFTATDQFGNSATCSFQVVVTDNEAPTISGLSNITTGSTTGCGANVTWAAPTITDNCSSSITTTSNYNSGDYFPVGTTTVTYTTSDGANTGTGSFDITVNDAEAPVLSACPVDFSMCPGACSFGTPSATDNCTLAGIIQISGPLSGDVLTAGSYTVTYQASDAAGNNSQCSFVITVNPDPTVTLNLGVQHFACLNYASFNLQGESPSGGSWSGPGVTGSTFDPTTAGVGTQTITYSYTDGNGCSATATDTIHVDVCTGISNQGIQTFRIYPNPATGYFWFNTQTFGTMEILNAEGKLVLTEKINSNQQEISLKGLAEGTYLVRFVTDKGDVSTGQLIIQQ